ncbi:MAG: N-acetylmuramic acid 6-phosphate etherase [Armatimonadetes bacterium]|nr:N-acetylmuramic acid 6-phosphate etherase [Armatimonadota bacterium]
MTQDNLNLGHLISEQINEKTRDLSRVSTLEALQLINDEDQKVALAVREVLHQVAAAVEQIAPKLESGGRLFYIGAGTSGRLGVVDASECPPTFGVPHELVQGLIAGGREAVFTSQEGAEDVYENGARDLKDAGFTPNDCLVGIAASGRTPYVLGALDFARGLGAFTAGICVNPDAVMKNHCEIFIAPLVGPEALTGSSRMKAGTAQKLILNMISTGVMLRLGRVEGNLMTHLRPSCGKLQDRARRLVMELSGVSAQAAELALEKAGGEAARAVEDLKSAR